MCGIAGIIPLKEIKESNRSHKTELESMLLRIKDRGPDGLGIDTTNDYAIGNVRLSIVGHEQGRQPIKEGAESFIFNGEIYNFKYLSEKYNIKNIVSDTYLLFKLLQKKSIKLLPELNGMFAFCFVTKDSIYLARDRFGKKPLFYMLKNNNLYFASEMKSFYDLTTFNIKLSGIYYSLETEIGENTIFEGIFQLEPGSYIEIDRKTKKITKRKYYSHTFQNHENKNEKQLTEELRYLVTDAINIRADTDKPYAVNASGGIDSSIIAALSKPKYLFSFIPKNNLISDEERYVEILASKMPGTELVKVKNQPDEFLNNFIDMVYMNEGPTTTLGSLAQLYLAREAKMHSIKITFSGIGADEFFNGYVRHAIATLPAEYFNKSLFNEYKTLILKGGVSASDISPKTIYGNILNRSNHKNNKLDKILLGLFGKFKSPLTAIGLADGELTLPPLLRTDDYINMGFGIEGRSPFMDYRLVEFALGLPEKHKIHINPKSHEIYTKYLLRKAFKDILPQQIYRRKDKIGFTSNVTDLLRGDMKFVFNTSLEVLQSAFPHLHYLSQSNDLLGNFSRWDYQICQLAITYLLFTKRYSKEEVYNFYKMHQEKDANLLYFPSEIVSKSNNPDKPIHQ